MITIFGIVSMNISAQVGIGTTTPNAAFEIESGNSGVLIPRVSLTGTTDVTTVINPQGGALVESTIV